MNANNSSRKCSQNNHRNERKIIKKKKENTKNIRDQNERNVGMTRARNVAVEASNL